MNEMTVGMENLPNVFIERIDLYPMLRPNTGDAYKYRIRVKLCMYDHSPKRSWYGRTGLSDLSIKVVFRGKEAADALNDGSKSLYDYIASDVGVEIINQSDFTIESELNDYTKFSTIIERELPAIDNLNVYAACFIDGLEFGNDLFNKFYGPMSAEKIFVGGVVSDQSGYFYHPDTNEEYGGPVHGHEGTYMEGSEHTLEQHATLRYVVEENYKIRFPPVITGGTAYVPSTPDYGDFSGASAARIPGEIDITAGTAQMLTQGPGVQDEMAGINLEVSDAIQKGTY